MHSTPSLATHSGSARSRHFLARYEALKEQNAAVARLEAERLLEKLETPQEGVGE